MMHDSWQKIWPINHLHYCLVLLSNTEIYTTSPMLKLEGEGEEGVLQDIEFLGGHQTDVCFLVGMKVNELGNNSDHQTTEADGRQTLKGEETHLNKSSRACLASAVVEISVLCHFHFRHKQTLLGAAGSKQPNLPLGLTVIHQNTQSRVGPWKHKEKREGLLSNPYVTKKNQFSTYFCLNSLHSHNSVEAKAREKNPLKKRLSIEI